jgi:two-component system response regulator PrrA
MTSDHSGGVLLVEDDVSVRNAVSQGLSVYGFDVTSVATAERALEEIESGLPDVFVLDVGLPGASGIELCETLRGRAIDTPILILSARDAVGDRVEGLRAGADDYLIKPFDLSELSARLSALLRRAAPRERSIEVLTVGPVRIDVDRRTVVANETTLDLTKREFDLLVAFASNERIVLSRTQLLELVWGYDFDVDTNVVDVFVGYLRKKLEGAGVPSMIRTVRGVGFVIEAP